MISRISNRNDPSIIQRGKDYHQCEPALKLNIKRGVKLGDPLLPLLFNLCIERIFDKLEEKKGFQPPNDGRLSCMAFDDSIILLAETKLKAVELLSDL